MKKSQVSAVMRELNARRNKKYGKEWMSELATKASNARWTKKRNEKADKAVDELASNTSTKGGDESPVTI